MQACLHGSSGADGRSRRTACRERAGAGGRGDPPAAACPHPRTNRGRGAGGRDRAAGGTGQGRSGCHLLQPAGRGSLSPRPAVYPAAAPAVLRMAGACCIATCKRPPRRLFSPGRDPWSHSPGRETNVDLQSRLHVWRGSARDHGRPGRAGLLSLQFVPRLVERADSCGGAMAGDEREGHERRRATSASTRRRRTAIASSARAVAPRFSSIIRAWAWSTCRQVR